MSSMGQSSPHTPEKVQKESFRRPNFLKRFPHCKLPLYSLRVTNPEPSFSSFLLVLLVLLLSLLGAFVYLKTLFVSSLLR